MTPISLLSAFIMGLFSSPHCVGMCGGIVGALTMGLPPQIRNSPLQLLAYLLTYNLGRISSYVLAGIIVSFLGVQLTQLLPDFHLVSKWLGGIFIIIVGLYLGNWWQGLAALETLGNFLWRRIVPVGRHFLPVHRLSQALGLGLIWGWLPCGLVYGVLALSLTANNPFQGGLLMFMFGMGTFLIMLITGTTTHWFVQFTRNPMIRQIVGILLISLGLFTLSLTSPHSL
ncbi:MAG: sulfite exporter TauE/SafE family protein [Thioploca sp.]|nr:sulfite exporter TauE/SafE family protein [Thioploca sp.]